MSLASFFKRTLPAAATVALATLAILAPPNEAQAFCGFYVSGADQKMFNNATMVVMMREGTKTVLSMRNNYEGPPENFAMIVPVPQVLEEENVKVLKDDIFNKVDKLASPRLVEYWEQDPCNQLGYAKGFGGLGMIGTGRGGGGMGARSSGLGVKVEAEFDVGEYNVVVLSAKESNGLETWLKQEKYNIPDGAGPLLKPYIEGGQYFFAAKVDPKKVTFKDGQAELSPLRFHYDSKDFSLPVRLGLINANGPQDLLVHILAQNQRYEAANYPNVTIPTNLIVKPEVKERFAHFYTTLFDRVLEEHPGAVVTEYSWGATSCDPCPTSALNMSDVQVLGGDVLGSAGIAPAGRGGLGFNGAMGWVLTRLHARYTADTMKEDLVFQKAEAIVGGRGMPHGTKVIEEGILGEQRAIPSSFNNFQGRYIILNPWEGKIECENPNRGVWGGPINGSSSTPVAAQDTAFIKDRKAFKLSKAIVTAEVAQLRSLDGSATSAVAAKEDPIEEEPADGQATITQGKPGDGAAKPATAKKSEQKSSCSVTPSSSAPRAPSMALLLALGAVLGMRRRRH